MKKWVGTILILGVITAGGIATVGAHEGMEMNAKQSDAKTVTMKGEILDMTCYMSDGANGKDHKTCASKCLSKGSPVGFLSEDGKAYFLVNDHNNEKAFKEAKKLAGEKVVLSGVVVERGGSSAFQVEKVEKGDASGAKKTSAKLEAKKWTCEMDPKYISDKPGKCPTCGMSLIEKKD